MTVYPRLLFALVAASTMLALMGTDLILPTVPYLPDALGGNVAGAQLTLAAYAAGTAVGLLLFGALANRYSTNALLTGGMLVLAVLSFLCTRVATLDQLVALRVLQGVAAAAPAVFAPGIIKALFTESRAVRALGLLGSLEALAPALGPIVGAWLLAVGGWPLSFEVIAVLAVALAVSFRLGGTVPQVERRPEGNYRHLLCDPVFLRYALSHAFVLGGLLTFVFGMPSVFIHTLGGSIGDFVVMQACGIGSFVIIANLSGRIADRFGSEPVIWSGSVLSALGALALFGYAAAGGKSALVITALFVPVNFGLGLRGPPGFFRALMAARGDDARGAALAILAILVVAALGTTAAAPLIHFGLVPLTAIALGLHVLAVLCLLFLPRTQERAD